MSSKKTNKSVSKRVKVTRNGKLITRTKGHGHYNSKKSGRERQADRRADSLNLTPKQMQENLPHA